MLANKVHNKEGEYIGICVGYYHPLFYSDILMKGKHDFKLWDKNYPEWRQNPLVIVLYDNPRRNMTKKEVAEAFDLTEEQVNDKLYKELTYEYSHMVMPYESITISEHTVRPEMAK